MKKIELLDSTLRDGAQGEGISFSVNDRLEIVRVLDDLGIPIIEAATRPPIRASLNFSSGRAGCGSKIPACAHSVQRGERARESKRTRRVPLCSRREPRVCQ